MPLAKLGFTSLMTLLVTSLPAASGSWVAALPAQAQAQDTRKAEADRLLDQGYEQFQTSQFEAALQSWQQALALYRAIKDRQGEGWALGNLGLAYSDLGDYAKAIEYYQQALVIDRASKYRKEEGYNLGSLGLAYDSLGDYGKAIEYYQQALVIDRSIKDRQGEGTALGNLGNAYLNFGNYSKAIEYHQQRVQIARAIQDRQGQGKGLGNLGNVYFSLGDYSKAIKYHQQALVIARAIQDRQSEGTALGNLGLAYDSLSDYRKAIEYHQQSLEIAREIKDRRSEANTLGNLGNAYYSLGNYAKAIEYQQQDLTIARTIKDRQGEGKALGNLGNVYFSSGDYSKAIDYHQQYLMLAREIKDRQSEWIALNNLGSAFYYSGQAAAAAQPLSDAIAVLETLRTGLPEADQLSLLETQRNPYLNLQRVQIALHKPAAALETAERGRARIFAEQLCQRFAATTTDARCASLPPITLAQIQQIAREQKATLVEYAIIPDAKPLLYIWVVRPSGKVTFQQAPLTLDTFDPETRVAGKPSEDRGGAGTKIAEVVRGTLDSLGAKGRNAAPSPPVDPAAETKELKALYQQLIAPIAAQLPTDPEQPVIFIPQGAFFQVPFAALQDPQGRSLIEQHTILSAPSIQALALISQQQAGKKVPIGVRSALIIGNPAITSVVLAPGKDPQRLPDLPGSRQEAQQIAALFKTQPLLGKDANKAAVMGRMGQANVIHLATHGFLDDVKGVGVPGAIALSPTTNPPDNGLLTADEILTQKLTADLVVLSACDTGRGKITGDGVIGLSRALLFAGTPSVVVSLWKVPDTPTADLMQAFYRQWLRYPERGKARALRQAMLNTRKTYPASLSWAAFTLIGVAK